MPSFGITHESGTLRRVLVHHPGRELELANLDPATHNFEGPVDVPRFIAEHKGLMEALADAGVEVLDVGALVESDPRMGEQVARCPNLVFTRDSSVVTDAGAVLMRMGIPSRRLEIPIIKAAYSALALPVGLELREPMTFEGGGFALLDGGVAVSGLCSRTTRDALDALRGFLFENGVVDTFVVLNLPEDDIHIDGDFAELPGRVALVHVETLEHEAAEFYRRAEEWRQPFVGWLKEEGWDTLEITDKERMDMAANFLTVDRDLAIHYEGNLRVMREAKDRGIDIIQIPGDEMRKGNGGVHCMTCPIMRT